MLMEMTVKEFLSLLSSDAPAPGGGSAAALNGALAAALLTMVCTIRHVIRAVGDRSPAKFPIRNLF